MDELDKLLLEVVSEIHVQQPKPEEENSDEEEEEDEEEDDEYSNGSSSHLSLSQQTSIRNSSTSLQDALSSNSSAKSSLHDISAANNHNNSRLLAHENARKLGDLASSKLKQHHHTNQKKYSGSISTSSSTNSLNDQQQLASSRRQNNSTTTPNMKNSDSNSSLNSTSSNTISRTQLQQRTYRDANIGGPSSPRLNNNGNFTRQAGGTRKMVAGGKNNSMNDADKPICESCSNPINGPVMRAQGKAWHPEHFRCQGVITVKKSASINPNAPIGPFAGYGATSRGTRGGRATTSRGGTISSTGIMPCNRPLALTVYFEKDGLIMCERCHTNATCERCAYCEEIIEDRCIKALGKSFHPEHFFCGQCGNIFDTKNGAGFMEYNGKAYCEADYAALFAKLCNACKKPLVEDYIVAVDKLWHKGCFGCADCDKLFQVNESFYEFEGNALCEQHYYARQSFICHTCNKPIVVACPALTASIDSAQFETLKSTLLNKNGSISLHHRFRALFTLKALGDNRSVEAIAAAFGDDSALLKHELAYVLGQMKNPHAVPFLSKVVKDSTEDAMVRHEAAEALGAIGQESSLELLEKYLDPEFEQERVVRETCELAIARIKHELHKKATGASDPDSPFLSVDPAPATKASRSASELGEMLMDTNLSLFERYKAMFSLRNLGTEEAVLQLARGFEDDSALFRHEIAYVFGQLQHVASVPSLIKTLSNTTETPMVRHECAEALGSIGSPECFPVLEKFKDDQSIVVKDSCVIGLDMWEHENSGNFQYADGLGNGSVIVGK